MRIGVVSDTHNNLKNVRKIVDIFNGAGLDRIVHTGDITQPKTLDLFAHLDAPMVGVYGNNDIGERHGLALRAEQHGFELLDPPFELVWADRRIIVVHDPLELEGHLRDDHHLVLHGHTHRYRLEQDGDQLTFNPGECAGHMSGLNAVGVVDLTTMTTELLKF